MVRFLRRFVPRGLAVLITLIAVLGVIGEWRALDSHIQTAIAGLPISNGTLLSLREQTLPLLATARAQLAVDAANGLTTTGAVLVKLHPFVVAVVGRPDLSLVPPSAR